MSILLHKVYTISGLKFKNSLIKIIFSLAMFGSTHFYAQQSIDYYGFISNINNSNFRMNSIESNITNYSLSKDWEFSLSMKSKLRENNNINLNIASLGKRIDNHYLYLRFTPGIQQEFIFKSRTEFLIGDTVQNYNTKLSYLEKYGFGYSYNFNNSLTFGISLRYFQQKFSEEYPTFYTDIDSNIQIIQIREESVNKNYWRGDIGIQYSPYNNLSLSIASANLFILKDFDKEDNSSEFGIKTTNYNVKQNKDVVLGANYAPFENLILDGRYETSNSFIFGMNFHFPINSSFITLGSTIFHDNFQEPFIAGVLPSLNYSNNLFSFTISYLKFFSDRSIGKSLDDFKKFGIHNIQNNFFSTDNINLLFNFALSFKTDRYAKFLEVEINNEIFPTFKDNYVDRPFATGRVVNLSDEVISLKPSCYIKDINPEQIHSPIVSVNPHDTIDVPFFIIIGEQNTNIEKTKISQANFYLTTINTEPDDEFQKPVLLHDKNNWDGNVRNLRYFVNSDFDYSNKYANGILSGLEKNGDKKSTSLNTFSIVKNLFNYIVKNMNYVSDRRATVDYVQFPSETIELKGGDCDDLSVCFSSILESIGIQTAFIDYKPNGTIGHVTLLVNTNLSPNESELITINDRKYFVRKNTMGKEEIWIPIEVTSLTDFDEAWNLGAEKFYSEAIDNFGLSKNTVEIIDIF